jgi:hypothetical protein
MCERKNTMVCSFERDSPRITALEIHDWIHDKMKIPGQEVQMIQIDGIKRQVYIKVNNTSVFEEIITRSNGTLTYAHKGLSLK